jgi:hypothetical protein
MSAMAAIRRPARNKTDLLLPRSSGESISLRFIRPMKA